MRSHQLDAAVRDQSVTHTTRIGLEAVVILLVFGVGVMGTAYAGVLLVGLGRSDLTSAMAATAVVLGLNTAVFLISAVVSARLERQYRSTEAADARVAPLQAVTPMRLWVARAWGVLIFVMSLTIAFTGSMSWFGPTIVALALIGPAYAAVGLARAHALRTLATPAQA